MHRLPFRAMMKLGWSSAPARTPRDLRCEDCGADCDDNLDECPVPPPLGSRYGTDLCAHCYRERRRRFDSGLSGPEA